MFYVRNIQFQPGIIPVKKDSYVEGVVPCPASVNLMFCYFIKLTKGRKHVLKKPIISKFCTNFFCQIALHGEQRYPGMFKPFKGMLFEWSDNNLELEKENNLPKVSIDTASGKAFYSLCDAFHVQSKKKGPSISFRNLRNTNLMINSSVCEQQNSDMAKDRYIS